MKIILVTMVTGSLILLGGCKKKEKMTIDTRSLGSDELVFNVEIERDGDRLVLLVNGEESVIDLSDLESLVNFEGAFIHLSGVNGHEMEFIVDVDDPEFMEKMHVRGMLMGGELDGPEGIHMRKIMFGGEHDGSDGIHIRKIMFGGEHDGSEVNREIHIRRMLKGGEHDALQGLRMIHELVGPEHVQVVVKRIGPDGTSEMLEFTDFEGNEEGHEVLMDLHFQGAPLGGEWRRGSFEFEREISEEHQFIEELDAFREVARYLDSAETISLLGIHMIRDEIEPENRIDALNTIIDKTPRASVARNAALILMIETHHELGNEDEATKVMIELVLSNSVWDYDEDDEDEDDD